MNDFAEGLNNVCRESIMFSSVSKPDIDFVKGLVKQQTDEVTEDLFSVYIWVSKSANLEDFFANLFVDMLTEKYHKLNYIGEDKTITNCGITTRKINKFFL